LKAYLEIMFHTGNTNQKLVWICRSKALLIKTVNNPPQTSLNMAFNSSAPSISLEEEQRERESLTEDEKLALQRDLYGSDDQHLIQFESTPESLASYEAALHQSLDEIPMEQKRDYVEALERSSQLVRRETPYQAFLRCEEYNASVSLPLLLTCHVRHI
jgi:hypothetical protein